MEKVQNVGTKSAFTPYLYYYMSFFFFLKELITWVSLHNAHVLNYIRKKKLHTKHQKTFSNSFSRSLPNTRKWDSLLVNVLWKMNNFTKNIVRGPFSVAQPHVVRWRDDLTRPEFCSRSCIWNSTLGHVV